MLNKTNYQHALIAVLIQIALGPIMGWWQAGALAVAIFWAREYAQAEYKCRARTGMTLTALWPWHVLKAEYWSRDAMWDWVLPGVCCAGMAAGMGFLAA